MVSSSAQPASRYRRRILGLGALATGVLYVVGAPIFNNRIESDLESRVPTELDDAGFRGVTATFSGQDGTLTCRVPLDDPEGARAAAYDVRGVRSIDLDRSCRVNPADQIPPAESSADASSESARVGTSEDAATGTVGTSAATVEPTSSTVESDLATVHDIVAANPKLAFLAVLLADSDIGRSDRPVTLFAPSNQAFDAVPSDVLGRLQNDPVLLAQVLSHHVVDGVLMSSDLLDGDVMALDGNPLAVVAGDDITVGGARLVERDITASNGVVHVIDRLILPPDVDLDPDQELAPSAATFDGEQIVLSGVAASEVERQVLVEAAVEVAGVAFVVDQMTVDPDTGLDAASADGLAALIRAMPTNLLSGESGFNGTDLYANGVVGSDAGRVAFMAAAAAVAVEPTLSAPPEATENQADALERQLNEFVAANPILFQPSSAVLTESAFSVIDRVARDAQQFAGIEITVEGHTDSDGVPIENLQLSRNRAEAVRAALVERGIDAASIEAVGFGSERPVVVGGVEDKNASRRVEFRVVTAP
jgi:OOP family OmpA-OmpF porin